MAGAFEAGTGNQAIARSPRTRNRADLALRLHSTAATEEKLKRMLFTAPGDAVFSQVL
jgi:hypothetical protein